MNELNGSCLCKSVKIKISIEEKSIAACHCDMCRRWSAGPFMTIEGGTDVSFENEENITIFDSSDWAERGFCKNCGTNLFYRLKKENLYFLSAGLFENLEGFQFDHQVFIDEKPSYYCFSNKTKDMTGAELFAQFGA